MKLYKTVPQDDPDVVYGFAIPDGYMICFAEVKIPTEEQIEKMANNYDGYRNPDDAYIFYQGAKAILKLLES